MPGGKSSTPRERDRARAALTENRTATVAAHRPIPTPAEKSPEAGSTLTAAGSAPPNKANAIHAAISSGKTPSAMCLIFCTRW